MQILHLRAPATSAGLASAYQSTGFAAQGAAVVATTAGDFYYEVATIPSLEGVEEVVSEVWETPLVGRLAAAQAYREMGRLNEELAEESLPVARETWPSW